MRSQYEHGVGRVRASWARMAWCLPPYPRMVVLPRSLSLALVQGVHRGYPCSGQRPVWYEQPRQMHDLRMGVCVQGRGACRGEGVVLMAPVKTGQRTDRYPSCHPCTVLRHRDIGVLMRVAGTAVAGNRGRYRQGYVPPIRVGRLPTRARARVHPTPCSCCLYSVALGFAHVRPLRTTDGA
jgi:hypothetical protein